MRQLSGLDNLFLALEDRRQHMHVAALGIYDQSTAPDGVVRFKTVLDFFSDKINELPFFRQRLVRAPLDIDRPYWIDDGEIDVEYHVRHIALPQPGDWRQLMIQVARIHSRPLDLTRPPWEAYVIGGLDNIDGVEKGSFALYLKMHHAGIDGQSGNQLIQILHSISPDYEAVPQSHVIYADREPGAFELALRSVVNRSKQAMNTASLFTHVGKTAIGFAAKYGFEMLGLARDSVSDDGRRSRTRFDRPVSAHRVVDALSYSIADCKTIRQNVDGITINDIFLAATAGGLRKYLGAHNDLPEGTMNALMPLAATGAQANSESGNNVSMAAVPVHTNVEDPIDRLLEVSRSSSMGKQVQEDLGRDLVARLLEIVPAMAAKRMIEVAVLESCSLVVSNVRGPDIPLYLAGAKMQMFMPVSIPFDKVGLNVTGFSYAGQLWVCGVSCRDMMPDPGFFTQCMQESFDELVQASIEYGEKNRARKAKSPAKAASTRRKSANANKSAAKSKPRPKTRKSHA